MALDPPTGLLDGAGGKSSKRLSALMALGAAFLFPLLNGIFKLGMPVVELTTAYLVYSAALQGITYLQDKK